MADDPEPTIVNPRDLIPSHKVHKSAGEMAALRRSIESSGFFHHPVDPVAFVVVGDKMYLVDGHHRTRAAKELGLASIPAREVRLPFKGYRIEADLFDWER